MSAVKNALNVAGSIGGIARAVGNLASLGGGSGWSASLKQASYGGIPFAVEEDRTVGGRRYAVHEYPFRDTAWLEDTGRLPTRAEIKGFLVEDSLIYDGGPVIDQRDKFWALICARGSHTLIHPTFGTNTKMVCLNAEFLEHKDKGRVIEVHFLFMKEGARSYPVATVSTSDAAKNAASLTGIAALANFVKTVAAAIAAGAAVVQQAVSTAVGWYQLATTVINDVKSIFNAVSTLGGNFGRLFGGGNAGYAGSNARAPAAATASDLLSAATASRAAVVSAGLAFQTAAANPADSAALGAAATALVAAVAATATDPADAVRMIGGMAVYSPAASTTPGQIGAAMNTMQVALSALLRRTALVQLATTLTTYQPSSQQDAQVVLSSAVALFGNEITIAGDAGDDATYQALIALQQAVIADVSARGAGLSSIAAFEFNAPLPALVLANRIYRDAARADQLVQQARPIHPAFMPTAFEALSE